ncbi:hypothetical protein AKO1_009845 [Acrasis kona]|uniref:ABC transporter domain-containing protein n=1 Tax=Acrasis kona TaxID=1008807 RepID=A0AAW2ZRR9_9EUKA
MVSWIQGFSALVFKNVTVFRREKRYTLMALFVPLMISTLLTFNTLLLKQLPIAQEQIVSLSNLDQEYPDSADPLSFSGSVLNNIIITKSSGVDKNFVSKLCSRMTEHFTTSIHFSNMSSIEAIDEYMNKPDTCCVLAALAIHEADYTTNKYNITLMYNSLNKLTLPRLNQVLLRALDSFVTDKTILPSIFINQFNVVAPQDQLFVDSGVFLLLMSLITMLPMLVQTIVQEKEKEVKDQLMISGASAVQYWSSKFFTDGFVLLFICTLQFIILATVAETAAYVKNTPAAVLMLYILFIFDLIGFAYALSFIFKKAVDAERWVGVIVSISILVVFGLSKISSSVNISPTVHFIICAVAPIYNFFYGLKILGTAAVRSEYITFTDLLLWRNEGATMSGVLLLMFLQSIFFISIITFLEHLQIRLRRPGGLFNKNDVHDRDQELEEEDQDVTLERERVLSEENQDVLRTVNVNKTYGKGASAKRALRQVSLGVGVDTCFGLLGPNGAGKTTLLNILSGVIGASSGRVEVNGTNVLGGALRSRSNMGVCPQSDRLWDNLTIRDHIKIYCKLRGQSTDQVDRIIGQFHMDEYADKIVKECSGGMKRKLSVSLAFVGNPQLILLDEPSSGMDPSTRRQLWDHITSLVAGRAIVLTSHSMEEIDALCNRIGIVVNGKLSAIGSSQRFKERYGTGYRLSLTVDDKEKNKVVNDWIKSQFPASKEVGTINLTHHYEIRNDQKTPLANMFEIMEANKSEYGIEDYSISQTTLEQVFLNFARSQITD